MKNVRNMKMLTHVCLSRSVCFVDFQVRYSIRTNVHKMIQIELVEYLKMLFAFLWPKFGRKTMMFIMKINSYLRSNMKIFTKILTSN